MYALLASCVVSNDGWNARCLPPNPSLAVHSLAIQSSVPCSADRTALDRRARLSTLLAFVRRLRYAVLSRSPSSSDTRSSCCLSGQHSDVGVERLSVASGQHFGRGKVVLADGGGVCNPHKRSRRQVLHTQRCRGRMCAWTSGRLETPRRS